MEQLTGKNTMKWTFLIILLFCCKSGFGQDMKDIENDLAKSFKKTHFYYDKYHDTLNTSDIDDKYYDSLLLADSIFKFKLLHYTSVQPLSSTWDFKELIKAGIEIATSSDKKFRIYSWNTGTGGSMQIWDNVFQYSSDKIYSCEDRYGLVDDDGAKGYYSSIFTLETDGHKIYLGYVHEVISGSDVVDAIRSFEIQNSSLNDSLELFRIDNEIQNQLIVENPDKLINCSADGRIITLPRSIHSTYTSQKQIYKFNGKYFVKSKN